MKILRIALVISISMIVLVYSKDDMFDSDKVPASEGDCPCPRLLDPVCASNGRTYDNDCLFECAQRYWKSKNVDLKLVKRGTCETSARSSA